MPIAKCTCKHEYQDKQYGKDNRVFNPKLKNEMRCTVCGKVVPMPSADKFKA